MRDARLDDLQAGTKTDGRNINNFTYVDNTTLMAESKEEIKGPLMQVKEESKRAGLELNIKKKTKILSHYFMANRGGECVNSYRFPLLGLLNHCDGDCSHKIRRHLLLGRKAMINLDSVLKSIDLTLPAKVPYSQGYGLPSGHVQL